MPSSVTCPEPVSKRVDATLGRVSVVMMAWAKASAPLWFGVRDEINSGNFALIFSTGKGTPMIPVEDGKISEAPTPSSFPASRQICSHARRPWGPVAQFAFPEFTTTARTLPPVAAKEARLTSSGAATTRFRVKRAAAVAPVLASASAKSGRLLALIFAASAEKENPRGRRILSGERGRRVIPGSSTNLLAPEELRTAALHLGSS